MLTDFSSAQAVVGKDGAAAACAREPCALEGACLNAGVCAVAGAGTFTCACAGAWCARGRFGVFTKGAKTNTTGGRFGSGSDGMVMDVWFQSGNGRGDSS